MTPFFRPFALALILPLQVALPADAPIPDDDLSQFIPERTGLLRRFDFELSDRNVGYGPSPGEGDKVAFHYSGTDANGRDFVNTFKSGEPTTVTLGRLENEKAVDHRALRVRTIRGSEVG